MNSRRRRKLEEIQSAMEKLYDELDEVKGEEESAFEGIPESFEGTERYELAEMAVECLGSALDSLDDAMESIREVLT